MISRSYPARLDEAAQVPPETAMDRIRDAISIRCLDLESYRPEALDLAAQVVAALHHHLHGVATATRGHRGPNYRRQMMRGEHPVTVEDLAQLALEPGREPRDGIVAALRPLLSAVGCTIQREMHGTAPEIHAAMSTAIKETADVFSAISSALADGEIDDQERAGIVEELDHTERALVATRAAVLAAR